MLSHRQRPAAGCEAAGRSLTYRHWASISKPTIGNKRILILFSKTAFQLLLLCFWELGEGGVSVVWSASSLQVCLKGSPRLPKSILWSPSKPWVKTHVTP